MVLSDADEALAKQLEISLKSAHYQLPKAGTLYGKDSKKALEILHILKDNKKVAEAARGMWIHVEVLDKLRNDLRRYFTTNLEMKVVDFKAITGTSRKTAIPLLEYCDKHDLTNRNGDVREKGDKLD